MIKRASVYLGMLLFVLLMVFAVSYIARVLNAVTIQSSVIHPVDGISCIVVSTSDGASTDCWRDAQCQNSTNNHGE